MLSLIPVRFLFGVRRRFMCKSYYFLPMVSTIFYYFMCIAKNMNEIRYLRPSMGYDERINLPVTPEMHAQLQARAKHEKTSVVALLRRYAQKGLDGPDGLDALSISGMALP